MDHITDAGLQDWVDGRVDAAQRAHIDAHLAECADCSGEVDALRALLADLHALPRAVPPRRDLHAEVARRIDTPARSAGWLRSAAVVALLAGAGALVLSRQGPSAPPADGTFERTHAQYAHAAARLEEEVQAARAGMEPDAVVALDRSLASIDAALREAGAALEDDPGSALLNALVVHGYERKIDVLRRAADPAQPWGAT